MTEIRARVIVASNRASAGVYADRSGPLLVDGLRALGCTVDDPVVVPDGPPVAEALRDALAAGVDVVLTSGGTGITPSDGTPEATRSVLDYEIPGIAEAIRAYSREAVPTSALSRALAGVAGRTLIVNLPGSTGGAKDGLAVLGPILGHAVSQLRGGDHGESRHRVDVVMKTWLDARQSSYDAGRAALLAPVTLPLDDCDGTTLATDLLALTDLPAFPTSSIDGYAVSAGAPGAWSAGSWPGIPLPRWPWMVSASRSPPARWSRTAPPRSSGSRSRRRRAD